MMMRANRAKRILLIISVSFTVSFLLLLTMNTSRAEENFFDLFNRVEREEGYYSVVDEEDGRIILRTARILHVGDEYINRENHLYRIVSIKEDLAMARKIRQDTRALEDFEPDKPSIFRVFTGREHPVQAGKSLVAIYHSHGAESYVPSDGTESIDEGGGILKVGETFSEQLEKQGIETIHSTNTHVPHDAGAYQRSRRTKEELLRKQPVALFDVHRDAVPPEEYEEVIDNREVVQILLVVGRQNQNVANNRNFAEELKAAADQRYPGLVKGVLMAQGSYNQDLSPRSMLLEVGGHENEREQAEESVSLFAEVVADYIAAGPGGEAAPGRMDTITGEGGIAAGTALWTLIILGIAVFVYLLIAAGGWSQMGEKLRHFFEREFADVFKGFKRK